MYAANIICKCDSLQISFSALTLLVELTELTFYIQLDIKKVISEMVFSANVLASTTEETKSKEQEKVKKKHKRGSK